MDDVVVVQLADFEAVFAEIGGVHHHTFGLEHHFDALGCREVVFDE